MSSATSSTGLRAAWPARFDRTWQARAVLAVILVVAATIRVVGSRYGFPLLVHPDEWAVVEGVVDMAKRNSFEPPWSLRPDHVEMKIDYLLFAAFAGLVKHMSIETAFAQDPLPFYWIARLATAAFGVATVGFAYLIGARSSKRLGLLMAGIFAIFPPYVWHSHYATPDVPLTFALVVLTYALMRYVEHPSWPSLLWASFAVALGVAIKYPAAVGAVMIAIVLVAVAVRDKAWRRLVIHGIGAGGAMIGFLFAISPKLFTDFTEVRRQWSVQSAGDRLGHPDHGFLGNLWFYAAGYAGYAGILLVLMGAVGLVLVIRERRLDRLPWFIGVLVWLSLSRLPLTWDRWALPMQITPLLLGAAGIGFLFHRFRSRRTSWIPYAVVVVIGINLLSGVAMVLAGLLASDTRSAALAYAEGHGITTANAVYDGYTPFEPRTPISFYKQAKKVPGGYVFVTKQGVPAQYAIVSSWMYDRVLKDPSRAKEADMYTWIFTHGQLVDEVRPVPYAGVSAVEPVNISRNLTYARAVADGGMTGPTIKTYRLPQASS